jgi:hypothetical protein
VIRSRLSEDPARTFIRGYAAVMAERSHRKLAAERSTA